MRWDYFIVAFNNVKNRQLRSWLTILGIIIGVSTIVTLLSLSDGLQNAISEQFETLGVSNIRVVPSNLRGPPTGDIGLKSRDAEILENIKGVDYVNPVVMDVAEVEYNNEKYPLFIMAEPPDSSRKGFADLSIELEHGRFFQNTDSGSIIIGSGVAYETYDRDLRLRNSLLIKEKKFKIIGIFENTGTDVDDRIYMVEDDARDLFNKPEIVNAITVAVLPGEDLNEVADRIEDRLEKARGKEDFEVFTPEQTLNQFNTILAVVQAILVAIAAISLFVGAVGIMNSMFTSVLERTKEIGVFKAIGAKNSDIFALFVIEAGYIGLVGGFIGSVGGFFIAKLVEIIASQAGFGLLSIRFDLQLILFALGFAFIIGMLSGFLPSIRASRLRPVDALRYE